MVQVFQDQPSFASRLAGGATNAAGEFGKAFLEEKLGQRQQQQLMRAQEDENRRLLEETGLNLSGIRDPKTRQLILAEQLKGQRKESEMHDVKRRAQSSLDSAAKLLRQGNLGLGSNIRSHLHGGQTAEDYGQFQSAMGGLEAILVDMVSRGTLSNARFKYITETLLPTPNDRERTIKGKLTQLAELLDLDPSALTGQSNMQKGMEKRPPLTSFGH